MHGTMVGNGTDDHKGGSHKIQVMKMGCIITMLKRCEGHHNISRRLPEEGDIQEQQITNTMNLPVLVY